MLGAGRMEVENSFRLEKFEKIRFNQYSERGKYTEGVRIFTF